MDEKQAKVKTQLESEAQTAIAELLKWMEANPAPTLTEIEEVVLKLRKRLGEQMAQAVIASQVSLRPVPGPKCPRCGSEMHYKDQKANTVESRVGTLPLERGYYYCETCRQGLFPPG